MCSSCELFSYSDIPCQQNKANVGKKGALEVSLEISINI